MRIVQPSVAKRISFSRWARGQGLRRHTSVSFYLPDDVTPPEDLMAGAFIDGKPATLKPVEKPKTRRRRTTRGVLAEPSPPREGTDDEPEFSDPAPASPVVFESNTTTSASGYMPPAIEETKEE